MKLNLPPVPSGDLPFSRCDGDERTGSGQNAAPKRPYVDGLLIGISIVCPVHALKFDLKSRKPSCPAVPRIEDLSGAADAGRRHALEVGRDESVG